jgi:hypothetical protein
MARERKYGWNGELPAKAAGGQKAIVLTGLQAHAGELHTGHEWAEIIGPELKTKQDPYRVVLYYILILKADGCIATEEFDINAVTRTEEGRRNVIVKSATTKDVGEPLVEPDTPEAVESELDTLGAA